MSKRILFALAALILAGAGIYFRAANAHSARLQADNIVKADAASTDAAPRIAILKDFVQGHMGASVSFTLKSSYDRAVQAAQASAPAAPTPNSQVYADAQRACAGKTDSITQAKCNEAYIAAHLQPVSAATPAPVVVPSVANYQYAFIAPLWTPDLAGGLLLGAAVAALLALVLRNKKRL